PHRARPPEAPRRADDRGRATPGWPSAGGGRALRACARHRRPRGGARVMHAIDVRDLLGHPGASKVERLHDTIGDLGTELARVPEDVPVEGELLLESVLEGILATGRLTGTVAARCAR